MDITFIGCGDAFSDVLGNNSALVEFNRTNLLIDIPDSNYPRIKHIKKEYSDIDNIFITHLHADHINGLSRFAYYRKYVTPVIKKDKDIPKANLFIPETIYFGLWDSVKHGLGFTTDGIKSLEEYFNVILVKDSFQIADVTFHLTKTTHVPNMNSYGLLVKNEFFYSSDSAYKFTEIREHINSVKKIFHDIHFFEQSISAHASIRDFSHLDKNEKKMIYAMHYDDSKHKVKQIDGINLVKPYKKIKI